MNKRLSGGVTVYKDSGKGNTKNIINLLIYIIGFSISFLVFAITSTSLDIVGILSQGAILATFGAALMSIADIFERDKLERVKVNVKVFYIDINKVEPWTRWPFLSRRSTHKLYKNQSILSELKNPQFEFDVGSHTEAILIPTVLEDFFDLPIFRDWFTMKRFKKAFLTKNRRDQEKGEEGSKEQSNTYMSYLCLYDVIKSACIFRLARILKHFSIAIIIGSVIMSGLCIKYPKIVGCMDLVNTNKIERLKDKNIKPQTTKENKKNVGIKDSKKTYIEN